MSCLRRWVRCLFAINVLFIHTLQNRQVESCSEMLDYSSTIWCTHYQPNTIRTFWSLMRANTAFDFLAIQSFLAYARRIMFQNHIWMLLSWWRRAFDHYCRRGCLASILQPAEISNKTDRRRAWTALTSFAAAATAMWLLLTTMMAPKQIVGLAFGCREASWNKMNSCRRATVTADIRKHKNEMPTILSIYIFMRPFRSI